MGSSGNECSAFDSGVLFSELRPTDALVSANSVQTAAVLGTDSLGCPCDCSGSGSGVLFFGNRAGRLRQVFRAFRSPRSRSGLGSPSSASLGPIVFMSEDEGHQGSRCYHTTSTHQPLHILKAIRKLLSMPQLLLLPNLNPDEGQPGFPILVKHVPHLCVHW